MPLAANGPCLVITAKNGYVRNNSSWVIERLLRDYDFWMDSTVRGKLEEMLDERLI
jgi:hypothetical protein